MTAEEFKASVLPHYMDMFRVAASVMRSSDTAADAVQDAIIRLWDGRDRLADVADVRSYCLNAVRNVCLNSIRSRKKTLSAETAPEVLSEEDVHGEVEWRDYSDYVGKAMCRLPADQRYVLRLSAYGGFSNAEIAELLGITQGNVRVLLCRARNRLKELLSK